MNDYDIENGQITFFNIPKQVKFWDCGGHQYRGGVGINHYIVCGCCGGTVSLHSLYRDYQSGDYNDIPDEVIHVYGSWVNISEEIIGE